jgi:ABC-2 type transport system permease protein
VGTVIYVVTKFSIETMAETPGLTYLPPLHPLSVSLMLLFFMLLTSNVASSFIFLFLAKDLDRVMASPVSPLRVFISKFSHILIISSWMPFVFLLPFLIAFGTHHTAPFYFYLLAPLILIPFFIIPAAFGLCLATIVSLILPARRNKIARILFFILIISTLYGLLSLFRTAFMDDSSSIQLTRIIRMFTMPSTQWFPSRWVASIFNVILSKKNDPILPEILLLYSSAVWTVCFSYILIEILLPRAYSNTQIESSARSVNRYSTNRFLLRLLSPLPQLVKHTFLREIRVVVRDVGYLFEVLMLLSLSAIYMANLKSYIVVDKIPLAERAGWAFQIFLMNITMNAFIMTSLCVRFVFPSVSREGEAFWILTTSPVSRNKILMLKFQCWLVPVIIISEIFLMISASLLKIPWPMLIMYAVSCMGICISIVAAAIGFGAMHSLRGESDHPAQVSGGLGSFVFMIFSVLIIFINLIPICVITSIANIQEQTIISISPIILIVGFLGLGLYFNIKIGMWALKQGELTLSKQMH